MIEHSSIGGGNGIVMIDPVCAAIPDVGTCNEATVGAAVNGSTVDRHTISVYREFRLTLFEAGSEIRVAPRDSDRSLPSGVTTRRIEADKVELPSPALIDIVLKVPFKVVEKTIGWHGIPEGNLEKAGLLVLSGRPPYCTTRAIDGGNTPRRLAAEAPSGVKVSLRNTRTEEAGMIGVQGLVLVWRRGLEARPQRLCGILRIEQGKYVPPADENGFRGSCQLDLVRRPAARAVPGCPRRDTDDLLYEILKGCFRRI